MPIDNGTEPTQGKGFGRLNKKQKREAEGLIEKVEADNVKRERNSIYTSDNFHIDARRIENNSAFKVDVQGKKALGSMTFAVAIVGAGVIDTGEVQAALKLSLENQLIYRVT